MLARHDDQHRDAHLLGRRLHRARHHVDRLWRAVRRGGRAEADRRRTGQRAVGPGAGLLAGLARLGIRRHRHGTHRRPDRREVDRGVRRADDRRRPRGVHRRQHLAALGRPRAVHRPARQRRHQRAVLRLCQPLVRPPPRHRAGADLQRPVCRRRHLAAGVRARHRAVRLAPDHAGVRRRRGARGGAARAADPARRRPRRRSPPWPAAQRAAACSVCRPTW